MILKDEYALGLLLNTSTIPFPLDRRILFYEIILIKRCGVIPTFHFSNKLYYSPKYKCLKDLSELKWDREWLIY